MNPRIARKVRNEGCEDCPMSDGAREVCMTAVGPSDAEVAIVTRNPTTERSRKALESQLEKAGLDTEGLAWLSAIKCRNFDRDATPKDVRTCAPYLRQELDIIQPKWVLTLGNEALLATTKNSGIQKYRGRLVEMNGSHIFSTISPAAVLRRPGEARAFEADLKFFARSVQGKAVKLKPPKARMCLSDDDLDELIVALLHSQVSSYDVETTISVRSEYDDAAAIISIAFTLADAEGNVTVWAVPLYHPESPFEDNWREVLKILAVAIITPPKQVAHNGKFDARWLRRFDVPATCTFDTMLAAHVLEENRAKGLKPLARTELGVANWAVDTRSLLEMPIKKVLRYNALDTFYTYHLYLLLRQQLIDQPRLLRIFVKLLMPALDSLIEAERRGVWIDQVRLRQNTEQIEQALREVEEKILEFVPDNPPHDPNFNPVTKFMAWWLWEYLKLPIVKRSKKSGKPSFDEEAMLLLKGEHEVVELLIERSGYSKMLTSFLRPYAEVIDSQGRIHTSFKLHGTVTGRLSSGKEDGDA